jgi:hypothetical protein
LSMDMCFILKNTGMKERHIIVVFVLRDRLVMGRGHVFFFFSRDRMFVSSYVLLASLTNSLLFFSNALYPKTLLFFV